jgi:tetratricopeptide (TPR) repeat protein
MKNTLRAISIVLMTSFTVSASAAQLEIDTIEQAVNQLDRTTILELTSEYKAYDLAFAQYKLAVVANVQQDKDTAIAALDKAIVTLETMLKDEPNHVEVLALLAQVYGYKAGLQPMKAIVYGPKSNRAIAQAEALAPEHPRVQLVKGIIKVNTPALFGGSNEQGKQALDKSIQAFSQDLGSDYHWGYADAHTWRGIIHNNAGNTDLARVDWQKAVEINPDSGWARSLLSKHKAK